MITFSQTYLSDSLISNLDKLGYVQPTPIQSKLIPKIFQGQDVLGIAQTGTGKTAAYALPLIDLIYHSRRRSGMASCLILVPTRELAEQVASSFEKYGRKHHIRTATLIGGMAQTKQLSALSKGADVIIATPGRFLDFYDKGKILLANIKFFVIDEADRMLDMGFLPDMQRINNLLPQRKQSLFLSATMLPSIQKCAEEILRNPVVVKIKPSETVNKVIEQKFVQVTAEISKSDQMKRRMLRDLIKKHEISNAIIFCNRKNDVDILEKSMNRYGYKVRGFHGDIHQSKRLEYLTSFKEGHIDFLIASDIAARGIDIDGLPNVINYDFPMSSEEYIHRIGRTGRAGMSGNAWTFLTDKECARAKKVLPETLDFIHLSKESVPSQKSPKPSNEKEAQLPESSKPSNEKETQLSESPKGFGGDIPDFMLANFDLSLID